jgi:uncharacterized protein (TIGR01244 family)
MKFVAIAVLCCVCGCASTIGHRVRGIDNFAEVEPGLCRGAQPSSAGIKELAHRGIRTIINLRDDPVSSEPKDVAAAGMVYVHIPSNAAIVSPAKISRFLQEVQTQPRPIFVHCRAGRDRTGLQIAMYRMVVEKWPRDRAIAELYAHGYNWMLYPGIAQYLHDFPFTPNDAAAHQHRVITFPGTSSKKPIPSRLR